MAHAVDGACPASRRASVRAQGRTHLFHPVHPRPFAERGGGGVEAVLAAMGVDDA